MRLLPDPLLADRDRLLARSSASCSCATATSTRSGTSSPRPASSSRRSSTRSASCPSGCTFYLYLWPPTPVIQFSRSVLVEGRRAVGPGAPAAARSPALILVVGVLVFRRYARRAPRRTCDARAGPRNARRRASASRSRASGGTPSASTCSACFRRRRYERLDVLRGRRASAVRPGETLGIMGRNGCGKSTLLKIVVRHLPAGRRRGRGARADHADPRARASAGTPSSTRSTTSC